MPAPEKPGLRTHDTLGRNTLGRNTLGRSAGARQAAPGRTQRLADEVSSCKNEWLSILKNRKDMHVNVEHGTFCSKISIGSLRPTGSQPNTLIAVLAEGVGFEPTIRFPVYTLSKRAP
jgi:hypothetical protein